LVLPQIRPEEAEIFARRVAGDLHLRGKARVLGGHLDTLTGLVVLPAVVEAADAVPLHPAGAELRPPVRAAKRHQVRRAALAAIEREVLAHDADRLRVAGRQIERVVDRLPEAAEIPSGERARP